MGYKNENYIFKKKKMEILNQLLIIYCNYFIGKLCNARLKYTKQGLNFEN